MTKKIDLTKVAAENGWDLIELPDGSFKLKTPGRNFISSRADYVVSMAISRSRRNVTLNGKSMTKDKAAKLVLGVKPEEKPVVGFPIPVVTPDPELPHSEGRVTTPPEADESQAAPEDDRPWDDGEGF